MFMAESVYLVVNSFTRRSFTLCVLFSHTHSDTLFCSHSNEWRGWGDASAAAACVYNYSRCEMFSALLYVYNNIDFFFLLNVTILFMLLVLYNAVSSYFSEYSTIYNGYYYYERNTLLLSS